MCDDCDRMLELLRWAIQVIDGDLGHEVAQRNGPTYREAKDTVARLPTEDPSDAEIEKE